MRIETRFLLDLHNGNAASYRTFATENDLSVAYVRQLAQELSRRGYISNVEDGCGETGCKGCPLSGNCGITPYDIWELTEKGRQLVDQELSNSAGNGPATDRPMADLPHAQSNER